MRKYAFIFLLVVACDDGNSSTSDQVARNETATSRAADSLANTPTPPAIATTSVAVSATGDTLAPNELGRIPILEYHLLGDSATRWTRERGQFRKDLEMLYARGFRPITVGELVDRKIDLPRGLSPVVVVFDDASPSQFGYIEKNGRLEVDPRSALGIWLAFAKEHPDWKNKAVFCMLSGAEAGRSFFGNKGIEGQKSEWRFPKVKFLAEQGFELCNHTLWHAQLSKYPDAFVQEQIARLQLAVDSVVPGYRIRTLALPLGLWPKNRALAHKGSWTDPKSGKTTAYDYSAVLEVAGGPARSPHDPQFNPLSLPRVQVNAKEMEQAIDYLDKTRTRYVSDGNPNVVAKP